MQCEVFALLAIHCEARKQANVDLSEMSNSDFTPNEDEGKEAWESLKSQLFELKGFFVAMTKSVLVFLMKNILLLIALPIIFGGATCFWYSSVTESYQASMTVSYVHLEKKIYADMIIKVNQSIESGMVDKMPGFGDLQEEALASVRSIKAFNLKGEDLTMDLSVERVPFDLIVEVNDLTFLADLEGALVDYLDSPKFVQDRLTFNRASASRQVDFYKKQVETFQKLIDANAGEEETEDLKSVVEQWNQANLKLSDAQGQLAFNSNIEVLHGLLAGSAQQSKLGTKRAKMALAFGLVLAIIISLFRPYSIKD